MTTNTRANAHGKWRHILLQFGLTTKNLSGKHQPCPLCGGKDRWRYSDHDGNGSYFCSGCGPGSWWVTHPPCRRWRGRAWLGAALLWRPGP